jgi:hypothetical protein
MNSGGLEESKIFLLQKPTNFYLFSLSKIHTFLAVDMPQASANHGSGLGILLRQSRIYFIPGITD